MLGDKKKLYQIYHTVLSMTLTWAIVLVVNHYFALKISIILSALYVIIPAFLIYLFDMNRKNIISYLLLGSIFPMLALIFWITKTNPKVWMSSLIDWCITYNGTEELYVAGFAQVVIIVTALVGAILFYLLIKKQILKMILAAVLMISMITLSINKIEINKAVVAIVLFYIMTIIVELYGIIYSRRFGKPEKKEGILYLAPICLLLAILAVLFPSKPEPIEWKVVKNIYHGMKEQIEGWKTELNYYFGNSKSEFFVNFTGYSDESGQLENDGPLVKSNKIALKISGLDAGKSVYLTGSVSDIYTGGSWEKSRLDYVPEEDEYWLDYLELFYALTSLDPEVIQNNRFLERRTIKIVYNNIKTKTFFYPLKMSRFDLYTLNKKLTKETPQINFKKAQGKGSSYHAIFYELNLEGDAFKQMLRDADSFSYDNSSKLSINPDTLEYIERYILVRDSVDDIFTGEDYYEALGKRADMIKMQYTKLPETLPDRVYELAEEITKGYDTKYDKLKAIENYLITNYTYSLDAVKQPEGEDFVDYFLFESKKGYCTYYATSMAVLGRCIGIPTRYVEGYLGKFNYRDDEYMYLVKNSQAHAWAEAYIEGIGWIPFEATAPFYGNLYTTWWEPSKEASQTNPGNINPYPYNTNNIPQPNNGTVENVVVVEDKSSDGIINAVIILLSAIIILILVLMIYYMILKHRYKKEFEKADCSRKTYMLFLRILKLLRREGFDLEHQETILMLSERVNNKFQFNNITFHQVADIFMRYRYAQEQMSEGDLDLVKIFYQGLADKERKEENWFNIWMEEFLFLARKTAY